MNRIFVEKKAEFNTEARHLLHDLRESLGLPGLAAVRIVQRYDIDSLSADEFAAATSLILAEPQVDRATAELTLAADEAAFAVEYLPGQFDQRADSAAQCVQILTGQERPTVVSAKVIVLGGTLTSDEMARVKAYVINAVDSHEVPVAAGCNRQAPHPPAAVRILTDFTLQAPAAIRAELALAMSAEDVAFCQAYFRDEERRDPSLTEIKMLDTYWSDHCRHTTFLTRIENVTFDREGTAPIQRAWQTYLTTRANLGRSEQPVTLMDLALIGMRELKASGELDNLEVSDEVNAACIVVPVEISNLKSEISNPKSQISNPVREDWLVMFKNETHNHPTEIEPFGGAATCLGGCIRDPLSGRSYVYQAMRVTGAGDPRTPFAATLPGKLPQKKICQIAAHGYSSYGNQIGLATGQVAEIYHPGYVAKRLEIGAVVAAAPRSQVFRGTPAPGDVILLIGGLTGRDGVGGATGSSKEHTDTALDNSAEVQKGDAPTERKIQRLFRNPELTRKIKICNDFGAGGVSVAIGEIAPSLAINLDAVPKKYDGLDGTELAISESQERMAVCVEPAEIAYFIAAADQENLECTHVATVTDTGRLVMTWRGQTIVNLSRAFLNTNGVQQTAKVHVKSPRLTPSLHYSHEQSPVSLRITPQELRESLGSQGLAVLEAVERVHLASHKPGIPVPQPQVAGAACPRPFSERLAPSLPAHLADLTICSRQGLGEMFDGSVGAGTVLWPFGGKHQLTPPDAMVAKLPLLDGDTDVCTYMSWGFDPYLSEQSPFHGAVYAVTESVCKAVAAGARLADIRLTLQEYFPKLGGDPARWGLPFAALLGAFHAQHELRLAAIGGKDSMSGSFNDLDVPPTLVSFALAPGKASLALSPEFKQAGSTISLVEIPRDADHLPDFAQLKRVAEELHQLNAAGQLCSLHHSGRAGLAAALAKMAFGNGIGFQGSTRFQRVPSGNLPDGLEASGEAALYTERYFAFLIEHTEPLPAALNATTIGHTITEPSLTLAGETYSLSDLQTAWQSTLEPVYPTKPEAAVKLEDSGLKMEEIASSSAIHYPRSPSCKPQVLIPSFPGTNSEYDSAKAFREAGAEAEILVFRNLTAAHIEESLAALAAAIRRSQILMFPGGFSAGDEPDGSAKFIATIIRSPRVADAIMDLLQHRDGLILGICNGFQALIKTGLVPYGNIQSPSSLGDLGDLAVPPSTRPTLVHNDIGRHVSCYVTTRIVSTRSPWLATVNVGDLHSVPISHGEGKFHASPEIIAELARNGQVATQFCDSNGVPSMDPRVNPNGSLAAIEGITSPCGRVFGKMAHSERAGSQVSKNIPGNKRQPIFAAGVAYFS